MMVVLLDRWEPRGGLTIAHLALVLLPSRLCSYLHHLAGAVLVGGVVEKRTNVVDKEGIKKFRNLLLVCEVQCTLKWDPHAFQVHWPNFDNVPDFFTLEDAVATPTSHPRYIQKLGAVDHVVIFSASHADASGFHLEAEATFIFPESRRDARFHPRRRNLARRIEALVVRRCHRLLPNAGERENGLPGSH